MSTVKISQLPEITHIDANTSNTILVVVDMATGTTKKVSANTLAHGLFAFNPLYVGETTDEYTGTIAQFTSSSNSYIQVNLENNNSNGSADYIVTATATAANNFIDMGMTGKTFNHSRILGDSIGGLDGYLFVKGNTAGSPVGGNLVIGTVESSTETRFIAGGTNSGNVIAKVTSTGLNVSAGKVITFGDSSQQSTAAVTPAYSAASFTKANDAFSLANSASISANTKLSLSGGTISGNLNVSGNVTSNLFVTFNTSTTTGSRADVEIIASANGAIQNPSIGSGYMLHLSGRANEAARVTVDSFGGMTANSWVSYGGRSARGSAEAPANTANGDVLVSLVGLGWAPVGFSSADGRASARIDMLATEAFSNTARGTEIQFWNTPIGSNTAIEIAHFDSNTAVFHGSVLPLKGFVYSANVQTASVMTVDFTRDVMIKSSASGGFNISLQNFVPGKVVDVWLQNLSATNQTVTHGVSANNSTNKSTTFTIGGSSCAHIKYFSISSDIANTFTTITYQ